ncbi:MAG: hypothetical protein FJ087_01020 [Deltaproteobacteria bacterium]|nr:hypothetical protein [Deltaproteobacteria bacterium]
MLRACAVVLVSLAAAAAHAQAPEPVPAQAPETTWSDFTIRITPLVTVENHGYFRLRFNDFYRLDLGAAGASGVPVGLERTATNQALGRSTGNVETANLRLSWRPTLRVGEYLTINTRIDFLDNMVLGETPALAGPSAPVSFARTQAPLSDGGNSVRDSARVKAAWADIRLFERIHVLGGRMPEHFGLGILRNDGRGTDSDFGDFTDAVFVKVKLATAWFRIGMEFPGEGVTTESADRLVPIFDAEHLDDAMRWSFVFDSTPFEKDEKDARAHRLFVERKPAFDWAMYHSLLEQRLSSDRVGGPLPGYCGQGPLKPFGLPYDCYTLTPRGVFVWTPALWGRVQWHPRPDLRLRVEAEFDFVYGFVDHTQSFIDTSKNDTSKRFIQVGTALEAEVGWRENEFGLLAGFASGGDTDGRFGVIDAHTLAIPDDSRASLDPVVSRYDVRHFTFNRDYRVDSILFREVIGAVTNAIYVKPTYRREVLRTGPHVLGVGGAVLTAIAAVPEGTPGNARMLGVEPSLRIDYTFARQVALRADMAVLFPLSALRQPGTTGDPAVASALRTSLVVGF